MPLVGCKQHGLADGDTDWYCYVQGGYSACTACSTCTAAEKEIVQSRVYGKAAAWRLCDETTDAAPQQQEQPAPAQQQQQSSGVVTTNSSKRPSLFSQLLLAFG